MDDRAFIAFQQKIIMERANRPRSQDPLPSQPGETALDFLMFKADRACGVTYALRPSAGRPLWGNRGEWKNPGLTVAALR